VACTECICIRGYCNGLWGVRGVREQCVAHLAWCRKTRPCSAPSCDFSYLTRVACNLPWSLARRCLFFYAQGPEQQSSRSSSLTNRFHDPYRARHHGQEQGSEQSVLVAAWRCAQLKYVDIAPILNSIVGRRRMRKRQEA
jgi:hypothetical protein